MKAKLYYLFAVLVLALSVQGCDKEENPIDQSFDNGEYGEIAPGEYVATGGYTDLSVSSVNLLCSINSELLGTDLFKSTFGVVLSADKTTLKDDGYRFETKGLTGCLYEVMADNLFPDTEYFYCAYLSMAGGATFWASEIKSFKTKDAAVDLGLPSGLKWASCNIGAHTLEEYGDYYAWGEPEAKSDYTRETSKWYGISKDELKSQGVINDKGNLTAKYDAATVHWGEAWRMPTLDDIKELLNNCTWEWITQNGVKGYKVTGKNGNSIFLPAAGDRLGTKLYNAGSDGGCWSSTAYDNGNDAYRLSFDSGSLSWDYSDRYYGFTVRPVSE